MTGIAATHPAKKITNSNRDKTASQFDLKL
jgi:hypothetical protein